jgi:YD repeat-containing protein
MNYINSSGELAVTRFTYTRNRNDLAFYQNISGGRSSRNTHMFDKLGRIIRKDRAYNDGETSVEKFTYDDLGRLVSESFRNNNGVKGSAEYAYPESDNASRMICQNFKGWFTGEIEYSFDKSGRRTDGTLIKDGKPVGKIEYAYESSGNLIKEHWEFTDGWTQTFQFVYEGC